MVAEHGSPQWKRNIAIGMARAKRERKRKALGLPVEGQATSAPTPEGDRPTRIDVDDVCDVSAVVNRPFTPAGQSTEAMLEDFLADDDSGGGGTGGDEDW